MIKIIISHVGITLSIRASPLWPESSMNSSHRSGPKLRRQVDLCRVPADVWELSLRPWLKRVPFLFVVLLTAGCGSSSRDTVPPADPAQEVLKVDARLQQIEFPKGRDVPRLRAVVEEVNSIDISRCPSDYQAAFIQLANVIGELADYVIETGHWKNVLGKGVESFVRGFMGDPFGVTREDRARQQQLQSRIRQAEANYSRTLAKYKK